MRKRVFWSTALCMASVALTAAAQAQPAEPPAAAPQPPAGPAQPAPAPPPAAADAPPPVTPPATAPVDTAPSEAAPAAAEPVTAQAADTAAPPAADALAEHATSKPPEIGGHVEAAYHVNLSNPEAEDPVALRSYDMNGGNTFMLHSAHLVVKHAFTDAISAVIELDAGTDAGITNGSLGLFDVQEAYLTYAAPFGLSVTAGKFVTYEGIEVIEGPMNPTITRGFLYGLAEPFTHVGFKAHQKLGEVADIGVGIVNGWDLLLDNNDTKTVMGRLGITPTEAFWAGLSAYYGGERADTNTDPRLSVDLTGAVIPSEVITLNFQLNYGQEPNVPIPPPDETSPSPGSVDGSWFGFGIQPVLKLGSFSAGARFEYFADTEGTRTGAHGTDVSVYNLTLTPGYTIDDALLVRAEYRFDGANEAIFAAEEQQHTLAVAASYMF